MSNTNGGGQIFWPALKFSTGGQTFLAGQHTADTIPSQVPITASYSDDLFTPAMGGPSFSQPYVLPSLSGTLHHSRRPELQTPTVIRQFPPPIPRLSQVPHVHHFPPSYDTRPPLSNTLPTPYLHNPPLNVNQVPHSGYPHYPPFVPVPPQPPHGIPHSYQPPAI